jgi:hypothetical protein
MDGGGKPLSTTSDVIGALIERHRSGAGTFLKIADGVY